MIRTGMRGIIELIRKHPKIRRILRCESPYFHHWLTHADTWASILSVLGPLNVRLSRPEPNFIKPSTLFLEKPGELHLRVL